MARKAWSAFDRLIHSGPNIDSNALAALVAQLRCELNSDARREEVLRFLEGHSSRDKPSDVILKAALARYLWEMNEGEKVKAVGAPTPQPLIVATDQFAVSAFNLAALVLPKRVLDEDLGDAMEQINLLRQIGAPRWQVILKVMTSILWALWSAIKSPSRSKVKSLQ